MLGGELLYVRHAVRHLPTDRVLIVEGCPSDHTATQGLDELMESRQRLCRLREKGYGSGEVYLLYVLGALYYDGLTIRLPNQSVYLGMSLLAIDYDLSAQRL